MRKFMKYATVPMSIAALSACADQSAGPTGPQGNLNLTVAPLNLPGIGNAVYDISVTAKYATGPNQIVWSETNLSSTSYGDGQGSLTYIGTCDAQAASHEVTLVMQSLTDDNQLSLFPAEATNPCPSTKPCTVTVSKCSENQDTLVEFNLAIMRDANQGFFDVAVNFNDIFCSAKVDCQNSLLHDAAGNRVRTAVIGFACTSGSNSLGNVESTKLHVDYQVGAVSLLEGTEGIQTTDGVRYAIYRDKEDLLGVTKGFWNAAVVVGGGAGNVRVKGFATAAPGDLPGDTGDGKLTSYPVIQFDVEVPQGTGAAGTSCGAGWPKQLDDAAVTRDENGNVTAGIGTTYSGSPADDATWSTWIVAADQ